MNDDTLILSSEQVEEWRDVVGWEGIYQISNLGNVKGIKSGKRRKVGKLLKAKPNHDGYPYLKLSNDKYKKQYLVHRLVAYAFLDKQPTPQHEINHKNGIKHDNRVENLEWVTRSENIKHAFNIGLASHRGERNTRAKLTWEQVREIRRLIKLGTKQIAIAKQFDINRDTVYAIGIGESWKE